MESLKNNLADLRDHFNPKLVEFQSELNASNPTASPSGDSIALQFDSFRTFVFTALEPAEPAIASRISFKTV
ncbi:unnamed protein product [Euphydryas editha]|uniref:Uncharacterized protein n=1 Tax=Euphydryas editha TaxID=104508 RepID=A0AAU9TED1_EUPED|nr:unnamed protein product [Euphydryas editha]